MNYQQQLKAMSREFDELFVHQHVESEMQKVVKAIEHGEEILPIVENNRGSFSTIFLPFHGKNVLEDGKRLIDHPEIHLSLKEFCILAADIENMTDTWAMLEQEPAEVQKEKLRSLLQTFLGFLPSPDTFHSWIEKSR